MSVNTTSAGDQDRGPAFCTVITVSFLAHARVLAKALQRFHRATPFYVVVVDGDPGALSNEPFVALSLADLEPFLTSGALRRMTFYYDAFELCCALRGALHRYLLERTQHGSWLFIDADVVVLGGLDPVFEELHASSILLSRHHTRPLPEADVEPHEGNLLRCGLYNAGLLGLTRGPEAHRFADWFSHRLEEHCFNDRAHGDDRGMFVDQLWLNAVPAWFSDVAVVKTLGVNVGYWTLLSEPLEQHASGVFRVAGTDVLSFHFSGFDLVSEEVPAQKYLEGTARLHASLGVVRNLANAYKKRLRDAGWDNVRKHPYGFERYRDGSAITSRQRHQYFYDLKRGDYPLSSDPFSEPSDTSAFWRRVDAANKRESLWSRLRRAAGR